MLRRMAVRVSATNANMSGVDRTSYRYNLEYRASAQSQMRDIAKRFLAGEIGVIEAARQFRPFHAVVEPMVARALSVFIGIDSETDALPIGDLRGQWSAKALRVEDEKITRAEREYGARGRAAAAHLVDLLDRPISDLPP